MSIVVKRIITYETQTYGKDWFKNIRQYKKRESLRIGTKDICLNIPFQDIITEISNLAEVILEITLDSLLEKYQMKNQCGFCILAFGKLGGKELNYSSDLDILALYDESKEDFFNKKQFEGILKEFNNILCRISNQGRVYRVDFRLRPHGCCLINATIPSFV